MFTWGFCNASSARSLWTKGGCGSSHTSQLVFELDAWTCLTPANKTRCPSMGGSVKAHVATPLIYSLICRHRWQHHVLMSVDLIYPSYLLIGMSSIRIPAWNYASSFQPIWTFSLFQQTVGLTRTKKARLVSSRSCSNRYYVINTPAFTLNADINLTCDTALLYYVTEKTT